MFVLSSLPSPTSLKSTNSSGISKAGYWTLSTRIFTMKNKSQLESFGFTYSRLKLELANDDELQMQAIIAYFARIYSWGSLYEWGKQFREGGLSSPNPVPVLLHVCQESRQHLIRLGFEVAFSSCTSPAEIWFDFNHDVLLVDGPWHVETQKRRLCGKGAWNIDQCQRDLRRVRSWQSTICGLLSRGLWTKSFMKL